MAANCGVSSLPAKRALQTLQRVDDTIGAPWSTSLARGLKASLRPFQITAVEAAFAIPLVNNNGILIADEMGLGKTVTSLAIMACYYPTLW